MLTLTICDSLKAVLSELTDDTVGAAASFVVEIIALIITVIRRSADAARKA
ncbi:hypothetical protein GOY11_35205 [Pseudomonas aeruginosa]|nr:hypothetical protein [Pseudomonas aeruginosa]